MQKAGLVHMLLELLELLLITGVGSRYLVEAQICCR